MSQFFNTFVVGLPAVVVETVEVSVTPEPIVPVVETAVSEPVVAPKPVEEVIPVKDLPNPMFEPRVDMKVKSAGILRRLKHSAVAGVLEGNPAEDFKDDIQTAIDDPAVPNGIKHHQLIPLIREMEWKERVEQAKPVVALFLHHISSAAELTFKTGATAEELQQATDELDQANRVSIDKAALEYMLDQGELPEGSTQFLCDYSWLADLMVSVRAVSVGAKADFFRNSLQKQTHIELVRARGGSSVNNNRNGFQRSGTGKTGRNGLSREQREAKQRNNQLLRAALSRGMKGSSGGGGSNGKSHKKKK